MALSAFCLCEQAELFGAGEMVEEDLALAGRDLIGLVVRDERRATDLGNGFGVRIPQQVRLSPRQGHRELNRP